MGNMSTENFYFELHTLERFIDITEPHKFKSFPHEWYIIITDIVGSTKAVEAGLYKEVNLIGACSIIAVLNVAGDIEIPFVFGGDGASLVIPPALLYKAKQALLATQQMAKKEFNLNLRIGIVPITDVISARYRVQIAKLKVSENYKQGIFIGGGLTYATELIKNPDRGAIYQIKRTRSTPKADFSGLECRWQDIPSKHGETVSLIVMTTLSGSKQSNIIYREIVEQIREIYGSDDNFHPVDPDYLNLSFNIQKLNKETKVRSKSSLWLHQLQYLLNIIIENLLGFIFMYFKLQLGGLNWGMYKKNVRAATDYRKFDDMLHMVITGNTAQRSKLTCYLEKRYREGKLVYGLHVSDRAIMTCVVFERNGRQVHFIDGADGGYALAAKAMKARMKIAKTMSKA